MLVSCMAMPRSMACASAGSGVRHLHAGSRARDLVGVLDEFLFITNQNLRALIVHQAFHQRANHIGWQGVVFNQIPELVEDRMVVPFTFRSDWMTSRCAGPFGMSPSAMSSRTRQRYRRAALCSMVGPRKRRAQETLAAGGQHLLRVAEPQFGVLHVRKISLREYKWLSFCEIFLEAKKLFSYRKQSTLMAITQSSDRKAACRQRLWRPWCGHQLALAFKRSSTKQGSSGGRAYVYHGYTFDAGPTVITAPHALNLFELTDRRLEDYIRLIEVTKYRLIWSDGDRFDYVRDEATMVEQIEQATRCRGVPEVLPVRKEGLR